MRVRRAPPCDFYSMEPINARAPSVFANFISKPDLSTRYRSVARLGVSLLVTAGLVLCSAGIASAEDESNHESNHHHRFNHPGNILITDQFNNRVIEIDPAGAIVWHFGNGPNDVSANSIIGTNDAERVGGLTLMAGTGAPGGTEPLCPPPNGCVDNRVMLEIGRAHV